MRIDALRRRLAIIEAARHLVAERGADVPLETVAESSGVGIATLYRNFRSRELLLEAVALDLLAELESLADRHRVGGENPAAAPEVWTQFLTGLLELELGALSGALGTGGEGVLSEQVRAAQDRALSAVTAVVNGARDHGVIRPDLTAAELVVLVGMVTRPQPPAVQAMVPDLASRIRVVLVNGTLAH